MLVIIIINYNNNNSIMFNYMLLDLFFKRSQFYKENQKFKIKIKFI